MRRVLTSIFLLSTACTAATPADDPIILVTDTGRDFDMAAEFDLTVDTTMDVVPDVVEAPPTPPTALTRWVTGNDADFEVAPAGPGLILMGGGGEPDAAFDWWVPLLGGGDVVILRVSGSDGYNDYLYTDIGGVDSVETLKVDSRALANDPYVAWRIDHAEGVFIAGGDQYDYISLWSDTLLHDALARVYDRNGVLGGTSAGLAVLGDRAFSADNGSVTSNEALADPFNAYMRFDDDFLTLPPLIGVVTDSHFAARDRLGRLVTFVARMWTDGFDAPIGIGVDEGTALLIGPDRREVVGSGAVYEVSSTEAATTCVAGQPLEWSGVQVVKTTRTVTEAYTIDVAAGSLNPNRY